MLRWVIVVLLAVTSATWVHAFSTADVTGSSGVTVAATGGALLAVDGCSGCQANDIGIAYMPSGTSLVLDFTRKAGSATTYGFQPNATYRFNEIVWITNNNSTTSKTVTVSLAQASGTQLPANQLVVVNNAGGAEVFRSPATSTAVVVAAGGTLKLDFVWTASSVADGATQSLKMIVSAN